MIYAILILYIAFTFWGSLFGNRKITTPESYFLADRNLGTLSLFFTILATNFSAFYFLGFAGEGYKIGYAHYISMAIGTGLVGLTFFIIGTKIWQLGKSKGYVTPAELIYGETNSRLLSVLFSSVMIIFTLPYLSLQIVGGGYILEKLTDGDITYQLAIILLTLFTIVYVIIGGMESVAKTDMKQGLIMIVFMTLAVLIIGHDLDGITAANIKAAEIMPNLFDSAGINEHYTPKKWFSFTIFWFFCVPMFPQLFMRFYIARDLNHLRKSAMLYAFIPIVISILPVMIGVWGHITFPNLSGTETDQILPLMLKEHTSEWFGAIVMTGAIAAFMSTLDSQLLALSTMVTRDVLIPFRFKKLTFSKEVFIGRVLVALFALVGLLIAFNPFDTIFDMGKMAFSGLAILFPITLAVVRFNLVKPNFASAAIIIGLVVLLGFYYSLFPVTWALGFETFVMVIGLSCLITFLGVRNNEQRHS